MTVYDDAELAAVAIVREALAENEGHEARSRAMHDHLYAMAERYPADGPTAIVVALARMAAIMTWALADSQGIGPRQLLDRFEMGKLEQQQGSGKDGL